MAGATPVGLPGAEAGRSGHRRPRARAPGGRLHPWGRGGQGGVRPPEAAEAEAGFWRPGTDSEPGSGWLTRSRMAGLARQQWPAWFKL